MKNVSKLLATWFGLGMLPKLPGTLGSLGAIPLFWLFAGMPIGVYFLTVIAFTFLSVWIVNLALPQFAGDSDPRAIVIDEVVGMLWALGMIRAEGSFWPIVIGFVLFRFFDISKWWLVGWAERRFSGGWGIVLDDVVAGIFAGLVGFLFYWATK